jgi:pteridine reductase
MVEPNRRHALVTGGAVRVGRAIAIELGRAGYNVAVHHHQSSAEARRLVKEMVSMEVRCLSLRADLAEPDDIERVFAQVGTEWGRLDLLVNSAAIFPYSSSEHVTAAEWDRVFDINTRAPFLCSRAASHLMGESGGSIVNIADIAAFEAWPSYVPYAASKAALVSMTRGLARAWAPRIRVNAIAPGPVLLPEETGEEGRERAASSTALGRVGKARYVADAVLYLDSSPFITGEVIRVDGGAHLLKASGVD